MITGLYSFSQIIEDVRTETGITNLRNRYPEIRQLIARAEREINPYAGFLIKKKMIYYVGNGNFDGTNIKKPADYIQIDKVGCCEDGLCEGSYYETVSHFVICDKKVRTEIRFTYWALQYDGEGNPVSTYNHAEAVVAYIIWKLYSSKVFMGEGSQGLRRDYETEFIDRCHESRGEDMFPSVASMDNIFKMNQWASLHFENKTTYDRCLCCESCLVTIDELDLIEEEMIPTIYYWQLTNTIHDIFNLIPIVNPDYLLDKQNQTLTVFKSGFVVVNPNIGRMCFAIHESDLVIYKLFDALNNDVTDEFDTHFFVDTKIILFVSKSPYSHSSIFIKFKND